MNLRPYLIGAAIGAALALLLCWGMRPQPVVEPPAPAVQLPTGGLVLERAPDAPVPPAAAEDARAAGGRLERAVSITVRPTPVSPAPSEPQPSHPPGTIKAEAAPAPTCSCEPVTVDLALVRMPDDTMRVTARARGGELLGGVDVPVVSRAPARVTRWAAGASWAPGRREYGLWATRDVGRLVIGAEVQQREREGLVGMLRLGLTF